MNILPRRPNARIAYRLQQTERANHSLCLAKQFPSLKSLRVTLEYFEAETFRKHGEMTYTVNLENAKAFFCILCRNSECAEGDFNLSDALAGAVKARLKTASGELRCGGRRTKANRDAVPCGNALRYTLYLNYSSK